MSSSGKTVCDVCGAEFVPPYPGQRRCGKACQKKHERRQEAARHKRKMQSDPDYRERQRAKVRAYNAKPEVVQKRREYYSRPEVIAKLKEYRARPDVAAKIKESHRKQRAERNERYATDEVYRESVRLYMQRKMREKFANDPTYLEKVRNRRRMIRVQRSQFEMWVNLSQLVEKAHGILGQGGGRKGASGVGGAATGRVDGGTSGEQVGGGAVGHGDAPGADG